MNWQSVLKFSLLTLTLAACTPALHLHEGDQFSMPYAGSMLPRAVELATLSPEKEVVVRRCGDTSREYDDMQNVKPIFDRLISDAEIKSSALLLKDVLIKVTNSKCVELHAIPLVKR